MSFPEDMGQADLWAGVMPDTRDKILSLNDMRDVVGTALTEKYVHEQRLSEIETKIDELSGGEQCNEAMYELAVEWVKSGTIKEGRRKIFGMYGDGGYWHMPKTQEQIRKEPDIYGIIVGTLWGGFVNKSDQGGQFNTGLFDSLLRATNEVSKQRLSSVVKHGLQEMVVVAVKLGVSSHLSIHSRLNQAGIESARLWDFGQLEPETREGYFGELVKALMVPKTPRR